MLRNSMLALAAIIFTCSCSSENDMLGLNDMDPETTPTTNTARPNWRTVYGENAFMDATGYVYRYKLAVRELSNGNQYDSIPANYQVLMNIEDTTRVDYTGKEFTSSLSSTQTLFPTGNETFVEGKDFVFRATEKTEHEIHCGPVNVPVSIEREIAKIYVRGIESYFEFGEYRFEAEKIDFRIDIDTVENRIYRKDILDGKVHMRQGSGDYAKPFVVIMDRGQIGTVENPDTPANPMPKVNVVIDGTPTCYGTITPIVSSSKLKGYDNIILVQTNDSLYAVHAASAKVVVKGSCSTYSLSSNTVTASYTAVQVNGTWKIAYVERNQVGSAYIYRWGNGTTESYTVPVAEFVTGGAKNLDEKGNAKQNPFLRVVTSEPKSYDNGFTYQVQAYNYTEMVANLLVGYFN